MTPSKQDKKVKKYLRASDKQVLIEFYKVQWKDIHDMNELDWRVALIFIPLLGAVSFVFGIAIELDLKEISYYTQAIKAISFITYLVCLYGLWTVAKGQAHTILKFKTLSNVEKDLCLHGYIYERHPKHWWSVLLCRRLVLYVVYSFLGLFSLTMVLYPVDEWSFSLLWKPLQWKPPLYLALIVPLLFVGIHYLDYRRFQSPNNCNTGECKKCGAKFEFPAYRRKDRREVHHL